MATMRLKSAAAAAVLMVGLAPSLASAASITITNTTPTWGSVVGGDNVNTGRSGSGNNSVYQVFWGDPASFAGQSGLGFNPANPPSGTYATDTTFLLGTLYHYNEPIYGAASSAQLNLATTVAGAVPTSQTFAYRFDIDETPNVGRASACPYPSTTACSDKITFVNLDTSNAFSINGSPYTIQLLGFSTDGGKTVSTSFISQEDQTNSAGLYARITAPAATAVPEPASLLLLGAPLLAFGLLRRQGT